MDGREAEWRHLDEKLWFADIAVVSCLYEQKSPSAERVFKSAATYDRHDHRYAAYYVVYASPFDVSGYFGSVDTDVHNAACSTLGAGGRDRFTPPRLPKLRQIAVHARRYKCSLACENLRKMQTRSYQSLKLCQTDHLLPSGSF